MSAQASIPDGAMEFGQRLHAARTRAGVSPAKLANATSLSRRRIVSLERGDDLPTERELSALATACRATVFELIPPGYSLRVLVHDEDAGAQEARGRAALDALLREYLSMVMELRSGNTVTAPSLRQEDLIELAGMLGDTPEAIEARLVELLDASPEDAPNLRSIILPSTS